MLWTLIAIGALAAVGWRFGILALTGAVAAVWLAGLAVLFWNDAFFRQTGMAVPARLWAVGGGAALLALVYASGLRALRGRAGLRAAARPGEVGARPSATACRPPSTGFART